MDDALLILIPKINASLNLTAFIFLILGYSFIKGGMKKTHAGLMIASFLVSSIFLGFYVYYHYHIGSKPFPMQGLIRIFYLIILLTHIVLAIVMVPLIFVTFYRAVNKNWVGHKKVAKITFPIWAYVSISGVIIYYMLYVVAANAT